MSTTILLVEDTPSLSLYYQAVLEKSGYVVDCAATSEEALAGFGSGEYPIVLLDLILPDGDGRDLLSTMMHQAPETKVIVITANGSVNLAVEAMRGGAVDFLVKPFDENRLLAAVENAVQANLDSSVVEREAEPTEGRFHGFIGASTEMQGIYRMVNAIGRSTATVFITGESGTGKEVCAEAIHRVSSRSKGPFVPLNCGAIPPDLLESEVFGHLKGSFTGAISDKKGAAEAAHGGTLFLDEICEMDLPLQRNLLRFLQTSTIKPVGSNVQRAVDVRIVCATNRDPREEVRAGRFREDLFYRLHVVPIHLPRLADREEDVNLIADAVLKDFAREENRKFRALSPEVQHLFRTYAWPGNVRQLLNALRHVVVLNDGEIVDRDMLPPEIAGDINVHLPISQAEVRPQTHRRAEPDTFLAAGRAPGVQALVGQRLADVERELIEATIQSCGGSIPKAALLLDVAASTIYRKRESWARTERARAN